MRIGKLLGINIHLDVLFLIFAAITLVTGDMLSFSILYGSVLLHEYGHSLVAKYLGHRVSKITLFPMGGISYIHADELTPKHDAIITAAGPAVSLLLAGVAFGLCFLIGPTLFLTTTLLTNTILTIFNIIPALPLDGGRFVLAMARYFEFNTERTEKILKVMGCLLGGALIALGIYYAMVVTIMVGTFLIMANVGGINGNKP